ncbi:hsdR [Lelliottia sp. RWM.1]|uniref:hsdR n=1 Tax=Lelliottia sp. RWM.1 TaxID=2663242 RepID=UPI00193E7BBA|nr:hsdR [Lelliottia sp. RWM.1]MBM3074032.1 hsdR [Lelliottia sp. RWM.1]
MSNHYRDLSYEPQRPELSQDVKALIDNGLDFLEKALEELESSKPKFSVVSFWTAVEILLKVPLVHEHWTLACTGKKIVRSKYLAGDFQSVTYDDTCARLGDILERPLPKATMEVFDKIRQHRNRMVHFYHPSFTDAEQHQIQKEQADAWFALNRLMRDEWKSFFEVRLRWRLAHNETSMLRGNAFYAAVRLKHIQPELDELARNDTEIQDCHQCKQRALVTIKEPAADARYVLEDTTCKVCFVSTPHILIVCPKCNKNQVLFNGEDDFVCIECGFNSSRMALLDSPLRTIDEQTQNLLPAGCTNCMSPESVCKSGDGYLCVVCLAFYQELKQCGHCHHYSDFVPELSFMSGCAFCEGDTDFLNG